MLKSDIAQMVEVGLGSDDSVAVWINGEQIHHNSVERCLTLDEGLEYLGDLWCNTNQDLPMEVAMKRIFIVLLAFIMVLLTPSAFAVNRVLSLDGDGDYVRLPLNIFNELDEATVEGWVKWKRFPFFSRFFDFGTKEQSMQVTNFQHTPTLRFIIYDSNHTFYYAEAQNALTLNQWYHIAAVSGKEGMKLYLDGVLVAEHPYTGSFSSIINGDNNYIGEDNWGVGQISDFDGQMDEIRVWKVARTQKQIRETMFKSLRDDEPGLVGYWIFEGEGGIVSDVTGNGHDGEFFGDATRVASERPNQGDLVPRDEFYQRYLGSLKLELSVQRKKPEELKDVLSITARRVPKSTVWTPPSISVKIEIRDDASQLLVTLQSRTDESVDWTVPDEVQGTLRILAKGTDASGKTHQVKFKCHAHNIVPVTQKLGYWETYDVAGGLGDGQVMSILQDRNGVLWFGLLEGGVCRYDGRTFRTFTTQDGLPSNDVWTVFEDSRGNLWFGTMEYFTAKGSGVCKYDGGNFQTYTMKDGLAGDAVTAIYEDDRGHLWFGTMNGASEYDGTTFRNYTAKNGFTSGWVGAITQDQEGNFWFGHGVKGGGYGATRYDGQSFTTFTTKDGLANNDVTSITTDAQGNLWFGTNSGVSKLSEAKSRESGYDGKSFQNITTAEGLVNNQVTDVLQTKSGDLWFATWGGVSRYRDGKFQNFTTEDGLTHNWVLGGIAEDREGNLWFGTWNGGVSRYDGSVLNIPVSIGGSYPIGDTQGNLWFGFPGGGLGRYDGRNIRTFDIEDGLLDNAIKGIYEDSRGNIWLGTYSGGLARYDGEKFQTFTAKDGLLNNSIWAIQENREGILWIGTQGSGVFTYDGEKFVQVASPQELGASWVSVILEDRGGNMWFSTPGHGVCRYDGETFTRFNTENGLLDNTNIWNLLEDRRGNIWIPTQGGAWRYDGNAFRTFTTTDGLAGNRIHNVCDDSHGNLWFGVSTGGFHKFEGKNFQRFTTDDGLLSNSAYSVLEDEAGNLIFATGRGFTIYTPPKEKIPPPVSVTEVVADKVYLAPKELTIPSTAKHISFAYYGMSFKTTRMRYNYMLEGHDSDWKATWDEEVSYENLKPGDYIFKVIAINRDLVYSETPATVHLQIIPPFYLQASFLVPTVGVGTILIAVLTVLSIGFFKRRKQVQAYQQEAVRELQDAREMQMALLPQTAPSVEKLEVAGECIPANTVGGDFYDYVPLGGDIPAIVLADVSGKGMKAAMYAVLSAGVLHAEAKFGVSPSQMLQILNEDLKGRVQERMNCAMCIATIDLKNRILRYSNAGIPYPIVKRKGEVFELKCNGMPLGGFLKFEYEDVELELQSGDVVVFFSDGVTECLSKENPEQFYDETGRLFSVIGSFDKDMNAQAMIHAILADLRDFSSDNHQSDDITIVVVKVKDVFSDHIGQPV